MLRTLTYPFMLLAAAGLALSVVAHGMALLQIHPPFGKAVFALHVGVFLVWMPAIIAWRRLTEGVRRRGSWDAMRQILQGCPLWMRGVTIGLFVYAVINFSLFIRASPPKGESLPADSLIALSGFSGHWMSFYAMALAILYSYRHTRGNMLESRIGIS